MGILSCSLFLISHLVLKRQSNIWNFFVRNTIKTRKLEFFSNSPQRNCVHNLWIQNWSIKGTKCKKLGSFDTAMKRFSSRRKGKLIEKTLHENNSHLTSNNEAPLTRVIWIISKYRIQEILKTEKPSKVNGGSETICFERKTVT